MKIAMVGEGYALSMASMFGLDCYARDNAELPVAVMDCCAVDKLDKTYSADIESGKHYRLQVKGQVVLFKIMTRKIWFFAGIEAMQADLAGGAAANRQT